MYDKDFAELVKIAAEKLKEDTVYKSQYICHRCVQRQKIKTCHCRQRRDT